MVRSAIGVSSLVTLCLLAAGGCSSTPKQAFDKDKEPRLIAVRNSSGRQAQSIAIQEDRDASEGPRRMGAMAPVAENHTYVIARAPNATPLPAKLRVTYAFPGGPVRSVPVDLHEIARQAKGDGNEAVVFELKPDGTVIAYMDHVQP
jgi:hypothetical protein